MIEVNTPTRTLWLHFQHRTKGRRQTTVRILEGTGKIEQMTEVTQAVAVCSPLDNFCYETGRQTAMKKALNPLTSCIDKLDRKAIWGAYWSRAKV